jgi:biotin carboxylase
MRILLTDGAGLTSRQVATRLDALGHRVEAVVSDPFCLARFTRHVHAVQRGPAFGDEPLPWFDRLLSIAVAAQMDVIFPTQEQVTVISHQLPRLIRAGVATAVPPFESLRRLQDKVSAQATLDELGVLQPRGTVMSDLSQADGWSRFPAFVKRPVGTGSTGVRRVLNARGLRGAVNLFLDDGAGDDGGVVVVQEALDGTFVMAQCVFDHGVLVAFHANERAREGANGSAAAKASVPVPDLCQSLAHLGRELAWHGALSVDAIVVDERAFVIDVNPRLVEPGNALAAGTDLVGALLAVALGSPVGPAPPSRSGVRTHQLLMAMLGAAQHTGRRRDVVGEVTQALLHQGVYAGSREELLPWRGDLRTTALPAVAALALLVRPQWCSYFTDGAVSHYSITPTGWRTLRSTAPLPTVTAASA